MHLWFNKLLFEMKTIALFLPVALHLVSGSNSACDSLIVPDDANCTCPGQVINFTCSIVGGGNTVWNGTAFRCPSSTNDIHLSHPDFVSRGAFRSCNNGTIRARSIGVMDDCYTSQLMVQVSLSLNNTTIQCCHDSSESTECRLIGTSTLNFVYGPYLQEPSGVMVTKVNMTEITFSWTAVNSICSGSIYYIVTSPNCSDVKCTNSTKNESTCSNLPIANTCAISISSEVCGQTETVSNAITVTLRRPQTSITPVYSDDSPSKLTRVMITIYREPFISVAGDVPSPVTEYRLSNSDRNIPACEENKVMCQRSVDAATFACPPSTDIVVSLSASNRLGQGPSSDPTILGCINEFVSVRFDSTTSTITCNFLDKMDTSIKSCSVMYGQQCDEMLVPGPQRNSTMEAPNSITLVVDSETFSCYLVTAINDSFSILVEVRTSMGSGSARTGVIGIAIGVILALAISLVVGVIILVAVVKSKKKRRPLILEKGNYYQPLWKEFTLEGEFNRAQPEAANQIVKQFELNEVPQDDIKLINIRRRCKLKELTRDVKSVTKIKIDCSFCEFKGVLENISEEKKIIFMDEITRMFFTSKVSLLKEKRYFSDRSKKLEELFNRHYMIFVESTESDEEDLEAGTSVLYKLLKTDTTEDTTEDTTDSEGSC